MAAPRSARDVAMDSDDSSTDSDIPPLVADSDDSGDEGDTEGGVGPPKLTKEQVAAAKAAKATALKDEGNAKYKAGDFVGALRLYSKAIEETPDNAAFYGNRAAANIAMKDWKAALADCSTCLELNPDYVKAYLRAGKAHLSLGHLGDAKSAFENALEREPRNESARAELDKIKKTETLLQRAEKELADNKWTRALILANQAANEAPMSSQVKTIQAAANVGLKRYDTAYGITTDILRTGTASSRLLTLRAKCLYIQGNFPTAIKTLREVLRSDPDNRECQVQMKMIKRLESRKEEGNTAFKAGKWPEAIAAYTDCLEIDPENKLFNSKLYANRAAAYMKVRKWAEAEKDCDRTLEIDENHIKAIMRRAQCRENIGGVEALEGAMRDLEKAKRLVNDRNTLRQLESDLDSIKRKLKSAKRKDLYKILDLPRSASGGQFKKQYFKLAKLYHPDRHATESEEKKKAAADKFKDIQQAYEILTDPKKKARYDRGVDIEDLDREDPFEGGGGGFGGFGGGGIPMDVFSMFGGGFGGGGFGGGRGSRRSHFH